MGPTSRIRLVGLMLGVMIAVALATGPVPFAHAQDGVAATIIGDPVNMRRAPDRTATVIAQLPRESRITITGRDAGNEWLYGTHESGAIGWVFLDFVRFDAPTNLSALPVRDASAPINPGPLAPPPAGGEPGAPAAPPALPPPVSGGAISRGFALGGQVQSLSPRTVEAMRRAGMTWVKRQAFAGDGGAIGMIGEAHANGFRILLSVIGDKNAVVDEGYQNSYAAYVASLAAAGADAIEVWNEQNIDREWPQGRIDPALYVSLLARAYNAIKAANPNTLVISGAPAPTGAEGAFGLDRVWNDDRYVAGMVAAGAGRYMDCVGIHYNEGIVSPRQRSGDPRDNYPTRYFDTMLARGLAGFGRPACFTELGYLSPEGYGPLPGGFAWAAGTTVAQQAQWLAEAAVRAAQSGRVRLMIVFNVDFDYYGEDPQGGFAIIRPGGACPACDTLGAVFR